MDRPTMFEPYRAAPDIDVLPSYFPIPGLGILPINAFVLRAAEPVLVDTGMALLSEEFMAQLSSVIDLDDLRWLWLTHADQDHIGSLYRLLDEVPHLRVITTFLAVGKLSLYRPLSPDRIYLLNPGQSFNVGDRTLTAARPPTYDSPETTGFYDPKSSAFFSADSFGALMSEPVEDAAEIEPDALREGLITWMAVDSPWLHMVDIARFTDTLNLVRDMSPKVVLSAHLPAAHDMIDTLLEYLAVVPRTSPFLGPDQPAFEAMLRQMAAK
jgi:glyoxylase-like metal-dependent hydrolase (beta-lactamase superfamily II)